MTQKTAQIIFIIFNILAVVAVGYAAYDFINIISSIQTDKDVIPFDTATYYLLLMSVFWVLSLIQYKGIRNEKAKILKYANQLLIAWFLIMLMLANLIPYYLTHKLEEAGYVGCDDPREVSRVGRGASYLYFKHGCQ
ncbi:MAG TPA: hypothetical protein VIQ03_06825 [Gammaproteobacteria bacterium]